jgi:Zn ribbon nucleic-acid-binding protein
MHQIAIGDEVFSYRLELFARVEEVFPAAVCVKVSILSLMSGVELHTTPQLWRADDIENLSVCRYCGSRDDLQLESETGIPFHICDRCRVVPPEERAHEVGLWW